MGRDRGGFDADTIRLQTLEQLGLTHHEEDQLLLDLTFLATQIANTSAAALAFPSQSGVSLVARQGIDFAELPSDSEFCSRAIAQNRMQRGFLNRKAHSSQDYFYIEVPIFANSCPVGTLVVLSNGPIECGGTLEEALQALARQVSNHLQERLNRQAQAEWELEVATTLRELNEQKAALTTLTAELKTKNRFIRTVTDAIPGMVGYWDTDLHCQFANGAYLEWFGKLPSELLGKHLREVLGEEIYALNESHARAALAGEAQTFERTLQKPDGTVGHVLANYLPDYGPNESVLGFYVLVTDVTEMKEKEIELRLSASIFESAAEGIVVSDIDHTILSVNPAFTAITGFTAEEARGKSTQIIRSDHHTEAFFEERREILLESGRWEGETWNRRKDGASYMLAQTITAIRDEKGVPTRFVTVLRDVTERWEQNQRLRKYAFYDHVTELPNRALLMERLTQLLEQSDRENRQTAVLFCDLDGFKSVNDTYGHAAGDSVLQTVARRLKGEVRTSDTVARLGGDEFVVVLNNPEGVDEIERVGARIVQAIREPIEIDGVQVNVGVSIGVSLNPMHGRDPESLLERADEAMYLAKAGGKNCYRFWSPEAAA